MAVGLADREKESIMATSDKQPRAEEKPGGFTGWIANSYRTGMDFSEKLSLAAVDLPYTFLETIGVPEDKTEWAKGFNHKFVGGVYKGTDYMATKGAGFAMAPFRFFGGAISKLTGSKAEEKPAKKPKGKDKKTEAKKAKPKAAGPKKAPAKKKSPPEVAAVKSQPETKKAA